MRFSDYWRYVEWAREFDDVRTAIYRRSSWCGCLTITWAASTRRRTASNTPDTQMADNDYALGLLVEKVSKSPFWKDTVIVAIEDDAQNGSDHVDTHRSFALLRGGSRSTRQGGVDRLCNAQHLRTIELLLGLPALGQQDAFARPMEDVFDAKLDETPFTAQVPAVLRTTSLAASAGAARGQDRAAARGDAAYWALAMRGFDFSHEDRCRPSSSTKRSPAGSAPPPLGCASRPRPLVSRAGATDDDDDD